MKAIWKFQLPISDWAVVAMPAGAQILSIQEQHGAPCIWALVDPCAATEPRRFRIVGTGHQVHDEDLGGFIGTVQQMGDRLVWHVFELKGPY